MVRSRTIATVLVFIFVGGLASGCRRPATPTRTAPVARQTPPGPPDGGLMVPAEPPPTGESADQPADGTGE